MPGAAGYEVEINPTQVFAVGSQVCCTGTTINTSLSPTTVLQEQHLLLAGPCARRGRARRPVECRSRASRRSFDNIAPAGPVTGTSIKNLRMRDNLADPGTDVDPAAGYQTRVPVVRWDPVPGASSYEVQVADWNGAACLWASTLYLKKTAVTEWTPLGYEDRTTRPHGRERWPRTRSRRYSAPTASGSVRGAIARRSTRHLGLHVPPERRHRLGRPRRTGLHLERVPQPGRPRELDAVPCRLWLRGGLRRSRDRHDHRAHPALHLEAVDGRNSYFVVVAKDANFTNVVDEGFTRIPAWNAPRNTLVPTTYPTRRPRSTGPSCRPRPRTDPTRFRSGTPDLGDRIVPEKQSTPPARVVAERTGRCSLDQPRLPVVAAYFARAATGSRSPPDPTFGTLFDDVVTASTSYSSNRPTRPTPILHPRVSARMTRT